MITACVVSIPSMEDMVEVMIQSLLDKSSLVKKVLVFQHNNENNHSTHQNHKKTVNNVEIEYFIGNNHPYNHALGLHECIDRVKTDFLLLTDPDIVYQLDNFDKFYFDLYEKYNLNIIGINHTASRAQAFKYFPTITNCLLKRDILPDISFLKGKIKRRGYISCAQYGGHDNYEVLDGKYLMQSPIPDLVDKFPNPQGLFDAGCNLWLWNLEKQGRWLSFDQKPDENLEMQRMKQKAFYSNCFTANKNNFGLSDDFGNKPLLLHSKIYWHTPTFSPRLESMRVQYEISKL